MKYRQLFYLYFAIALSYVVIKIVFVSAGYLHLGAIWHGAVPAVLIGGTVLMALTTDESREGTRFWRDLMIVLPVLLFIITPLFMYAKQGELWLAEGRLPVLVFYECMAVIQFFIALTIKKREKGEEVN